jgi:hypothetical protein
VLVLVALAARVHARKSLKAKSQENQGFKPLA